jgi:hypothetical protein
MHTYYFVGSYCEIDGGRIKLERFGQRIDLPEDLATTVILGGGAILPEADFESLGFTEQEISLYAYPGQQATAPEAFLKKRSQAHVAFCGLRESLGAGVAEEGAE